MTNSLNQQLVEQLYREHVSSIYRYFYYRTLSRQVAEDLTGDTFVQFVKDLQKNRDVDSYVKYLFGIARFVFCAYLRKKRIQVSLEEIPEEFMSHVEDFLLEVETEEKAQRNIQPYLDQLPDKQKAVLQLRLVGRMNLAEVAVELGKSVNYVKVTQQRALKSLRKLLPVPPPNTNL